MPVFARIAAPDVDEIYSQMAISPMLELYHNPLGLSTITITITSVILVDISVRYDKIKMLMPHGNTPHNSTELCLRYLIALASISGSSMNLPNPKLQFMQEIPPKLTRFRDRDLKPTTQFDTMLV